MKCVVSSVAYLLPVLLILVNCAQADDESDAYETYFATAASYSSAATEFTNDNTAMNNYQSWYYDLSDRALLAYQANEITWATYSGILDDLEDANNFLIAIGQILNSANVPPAASIRESKLSAAAHLDNAESYLLVSNWSAAISECAACNSDLSAMADGFDSLAPIWDEIGETLNYIDQQLPDTP